MINTLLVDLYPERPATATAANNLVRCWVGAAGTAVIIQMIEGLGRGWAFMVVGGLVLVASPLLWVEMRWGPGWREWRRLRVEREGRVEGGTVSRLRG